MMFFKNPALFTSFKAFGNSLRVTNKRDYKVTVVGASGSVGQILSFLLKANNYVKTLSLYDLNNEVHGLACDISNMGTPACIESHDSESQARQALTDSNVVVIAAGTPYKPGLREEDILSANAKVMVDICCCIARFSPQALVAIITSPLNSMVPLCAEVMAKHKSYNPNKIFGVTTLDLIRAATLTSALFSTKPEEQFVPVVGGHSRETIIPLLSQATPSVVQSTKDENDIKYLIDQIQDVSNEQAVLLPPKDENGAPLRVSLSIAHATERFVNSLLRGLAGEDNVVEYAFVQSQVTKAPFFSSGFLLGPGGISMHLGYGEVNANEKEMIQKAVPELIDSAKSALNILDSCKCACETE